jgi:hypothetical protein
LSNTTSFQFCAVKATTLEENGDDDDDDEEEEELAAPAAITRCHEGNGDNNTAPNRAAAFNQRLLLKCWRSDDDEPIMVNIRMNKSVALITVLKSETHNRL